MILTLHIVFIFNNKFLCKKNLQRYRMHLYHIWSIMKKIHHIVLSSGITGVILKAQSTVLQDTIYLSVNIIHVIIHVCTYMLDTLRIWSTDIKII